MERRSRWGDQSSVKRKGGVSGELGAKKEAAVMNEIDIESTKDQCPSRKSVFLSSIIFYSSSLKSS